MLPANRPATEWHQHVVRTAEATGLSGKEGLFQLAAATYRPGRARDSSSAKEEASEEEVTHANMLMSHISGTGLHVVCVCKLELTCVCMRRIICLSGESNLQLMRAKAAWRHYAQVGILVVCLSIFLRLKHVLYLG